MENDEYRQIMFAKTEGFWNIIYNLETEIALFWINGDLENAFGRLKHLYRMTKGHFKDKEAYKKFENNFKDIEKYLFDPSNKRFTQQSKFKRLSNMKKVDYLMHNSYIDLKEQIINSDLELYYGVPKDVINKQKRDDNILKVFGRNKR